MDGAREHQSRHLCEACRSRRARFRYRGRVRADRTHTLCFQCYRSARDSAMAALMALPEAWLPFVGLPHRIGRGKPMEIDRMAKYAALELRRRRAQIAARHALDGPTVVPFARAATS